ncbi:hypothetical protein [Denitromonas iodatirespirans]|uniref:Uncharacterized protein n=1 Tax=Denitromonas iodatirespirans TaxID=2795389 RepID=A0A944HB24_DENI1|nr:hypothetical protein [Denitromonas iodatirespirans]MBT0964075.1 hypothetical protein [Denitromonas iodatirespirans]
MWRALRISVLLLVLATVALGTWRAQHRATSWVNTLHVTIYPINADGREATARHIAQLSARDFEPIADWLGAEARRYGVTTLKPVAITLAPPRTSLPPQAPRQPTAWQAIVWSLQMRYWAWRHDDAPGPRPDVRMFVQYHDPAVQSTVQHSVGLEKGLIGLANVFASRADHGSSLMVIAHEMLHTVGATDKYDPATLMPRFPQGYAEPDRRPATPQSQAEVMAGRIPLSPEHAAIPVSLRYVTVGPATAAEIGWLRAP